MTQEFQNKQVLLERYQKLTVCLGHCRKLMEIMRWPILKKLPSMRIEILACSVMKLVRMIDLYSKMVKELYTEEMAVLTRTTSEMVINAAYLQIADETEVERFLNFDRIAIHKIVTDYESVSASGEVLPEQLRQSITRKAKEASTSSGLGPRNGRGLPLPSLRGPSIWTSTCRTIGFESSRIRFISTEASTPTAVTSR